MDVYQIRLFLVFGGHLRSPPLRSGWAIPEVAWYRPFLIWGC